MRWPWSKRAERYEALADEAEAHYDRVDQSWDEATKLATLARKERELNGWTHTVIKIFSGG